MCLASPLAKVQVPTPGPPIVSAQDVATAMGADPNVMYAYPPKKKARVKK